jgi:hypothetical protein
MAEKAKAKAEAAAAEKVKAEAAAMAKANAAAEKAKEESSGIPAQQDTENPVCSLMLARILLTLLVAIIAVAVWQMMAVDVGRPPLLLLS